MDYSVELTLIALIIIFVWGYRASKNSGTGESVSKFLFNGFQNIYNKYAPYSYQEVQTKAKELGYEYTTREYAEQVLLFGGGAVGITYMYFYNIPIALIYGFIATMGVPYLKYLKTNKLYSEYLFECIQVYCTNVINEFTTTQSFVKALEGVRDSGILEEPVYTDVCKMIDQSYANGTIDEALEWFTQKYPYYIVKNMHQLFNQITKEGAKDSGQSLENMMLDIDLLVEGVYRDKMDRDVSHKKFIGFGLALYFLIILVQMLINLDTYKQMLNDFITQFLLHAVIFINTYFIISGEKFYNEDTGVE
ncbi:MAG: hypothetical protein IJS56_00240 [Bacilli bacterium]|nr:hypothetical protein [Bacilli bacterium]